MRHLRLLAPDIHAGDAVGNHCLELVRIFNSKGLPATAYAERHSLGVSDTPQFFMDLGTEDIIIVSFSIYDPHLLPLSKYKNFKICYFHGITPPKYLRKHDPISADLCELGLSQRCLLDNFDRVICNSTETAESLFEFIDPKKIFVLYPITQKILSIPQHNFIKKNYSRATLKIIMLGRVVPHKAIEEGVLLVNSLRDIGISATLDLVGLLGAPNYIDYIRHMAAQLNLIDKIVFHGFIEEHRKTFLMKTSDLFFSASYHEGFGIPILEAMRYDLPIITRCGAIPRDISKKSLVYSSLEEAALMINQYISKPISSYPLKDLSSFYGTIYNNYSDDNIFQFFERKILNN